MFHGTYDQSPYFSPYTQIVVLGDHHIWMNEGNEQYMSVDAIYWHESYDYRTLDYDIMLMKMAHPVNVNQYVKPIALPKACPTAGDMCTVSGWGNIYSDEGEAPLTLNVIKTKQARGDGLFLGLSYLPCSVQPISPSVRQSSNPVRQGL